MNNEPAVSNKPKGYGRIFHSDWLRAHRVDILLFLLLWSTYGYFYQSTGTNEAVRFDQIRAMVHDYQFTINKYCSNSPDLILSPKPPHAIYPNKAPGMTFIALVPFAFFSGLLRAIAALGLPEWIYWHLLTYLTTVFTVSLLSALAAVAIYRLLVRLVDDTYFAALVVLSVWLGTLVFPYSTLFYSHVVAGSLLAIAFYLLFRLGSENALARRRRLIYAGSAGVLMGWSVATDYPAALLVGALTLYGLWRAWPSLESTRERVEFFGSLVLGLAVGGAMLLLYNLTAFGNVFYIPYEVYAAPGSAFHSTYARGWMGLHWEGFGTFLNSLASVLFYRPIGLLYLVIGKWHIYACNPVLWLALPGLVVMIWTRKLRPEGCLIAAMVVAYLLFISNYGSSMYDWGGGLYYGPRHLIPLFPFLALPLYFGARKLRPVFYVLAAISTFYMLLATAVEPRVAFPFGDIAGDFLLPDYLLGHLAQNTASLFDPAQRTLTVDSTAANLAKLVHIPGRYQLIPLMLWWLVAGVMLLLLLRPKQRLFWRLRIAALSLFISFIVLAPPIYHAMTVPRTNGNGLLAKYYRNVDWSGTPADIQIDPAVDFDWSSRMPYPPPFSVEWTGDIIVEETGWYEFTLVADDGAVLQIDSTQVVDARRSPLQEQKETIPLEAGLHAIRVRYFNAKSGGSVRLRWALLGRPRHIIPEENLTPGLTRQPPIYRATAAPSPNGHGLLGKYFRNVDWSGAPADVEIDAAIDFNWSHQMPYPAPFSVEWAGKLVVDQPGNYEFTLVADDGAILQIDGNQVIDASHSLLQEKKTTIFLGAGLHPIRVRYFNALFGGSVKLWWTVGGRPRQIVPNEVLIPE